MPDPSSLPSSSGGGVALYLRVSSDSQSLDGQERDLRTFAGSMGWPVREVYREKASARGLVLRDEYERVLRNARNPDREWNRLLVWSLDRWSREERFTRAISAVEDLESLGIMFHSLKEPLMDSSEDGTPNMGRDLLRAILPVVASFESRRKSERVRVAMRELKDGHRKTKSGRPPGRPLRATPEKVKSVLALRKSGLRWSDVARRVSLPTGTCRAIYCRSKKDRGAVENPPRSERSASPSA